MNRYVVSRRIARGIGAAYLIAAFAGATAPASAQSGDPIKIGFSLALTGPLAPNGKQALLGAKIWEEEINAKGGLLGRKVEFVNYDDQSNPANIPGIYTKLLDVDKVDLVNGPYGTNLIAPALPVVMQKGKMLIGLFGLDANKEFHYTQYFSMISAGPKPSQAFTEGYFQVAAAAEAETGNRRARRRGCRVRAQRLRGRPRKRQDVRLQHRLRQKLSARHGRLLADHSRAGRRQCRSGGDLLLSAELGRHPAGGERARTSRRRCSAAPWSGCNRRCSRTS